MGNCGTSVTTPFVLTPSGSRESTLPHLGANPAKWQLPPRSTAPAGAEGPHLHQRVRLPRMPTSGAERPGRAARSAAPGGGWGLMAAVRDRRCAASAFSPCVFRASVRARLRRSAGGRARPGGGWEGTWGCGPGGPLRAACLARSWCRPRAPTRRSATAASRCASRGSAPLPRPPPPCLHLAHGKPHRICT